MKIISWNINGLRATLNTDSLTDLINNENPDILCLSETKLSKHDDLDTHEIFKKYKYKYWHACTKRKGYSGTAIFTKKEPINVFYGLDDVDDEGRMITLEYDNYYLINVYTVNSGVGLSRLEWRVNTWDTSFRNYINKLQKKKYVIICGDLNVAHHEIDIKNPKQNLRSAGFTIEERDSFSKLLNECELIDTFRYKYPTKIEYTYWSYKRNARIKNIGWRLDYFLISNEIINKLKDHEILQDIHSSDHAPIKIILKKF